MKRLAKQWIVRASGAAIFCLATGTAYAADKPVTPVPSPSSTADSKAGVDAWMQGDYAKAVAIWRPLADAGDADAQYDLGQAYRLGKGVPADFPTALDYYRKASERGHPRAQDSYGLLLFAMNRRQEAMPYLQKSAERGEPNAQYIVGTALYNGDLAPRDPVRAYAMMTSAARKGMPSATTSLATMDQALPEPTRNQGLALAAQMEQARQTQVADALPVKPIAKPAPASAPKTAALPDGAKKQATPAVATPAPSPAPKTDPKPVAVPPSSKPEVAKAEPKPTGKWVVQLGAFSSDERANTAWSSLSKKIKPLSDYKPIFAKGGTITRLQAGPLPARTDAEKLCSTVKAAGADCIPKAM